MWEGSRLTDAPSRTSANHRVPVGRAEQAQALSPRALGRFVCYVTCLALLQVLCS